MENKYDYAEEISSAFTHAIGGYLGAAAVVLLVMFAIQSGEQITWKIVAGSIFAATIIILYSASTIFHAISDLRMKDKARIGDQIAIYLLIAGTYTPFCLVTLRQEYPIFSWTVFIFIWGLAISGIVFKLFAKGVLNYFTTFTYLAMGWFALAIIKPLYSVFPFAGIVWLILGGVLYSLGVVFYLWRAIPLNHTIWHLFVLGGTICHFFCILFYVIM